MLVEDDNNLREIYEARLLAEGYEIVSARDGEEALALAVKERPDLIIADVMMPKISGFDMLDILRSTPETKTTKVIMMTALSQAEDKARAAQLGADRYLVKSQVTLEDVAKVAREVLEGKTSSDPVTPVTPPVPVAPVLVTPAPAPVQPPIDPTPPVMPPPATPMPPAEPPAAAPPPPPPPMEPPVAPVVMAPPAPVAMAPMPPSVVAAAPTTATPTQMLPLGETVSAEAAEVQSQIDRFVNGDSTPVAPVNPSQPVVIAPTTAATDPAANDRTMVQPPTPPAPPGTGSAPPADGSVAPRTSVHTKIIQPLNDVNLKGPDLQSLLAKEEEKERMAAAIQPIIDRSAVAAPDVAPPEPPRAVDMTDALDPNAISL